jgi:hypothetical protein
MEGKPQQADQPNIESQVNEALEQIKVQRERAQRENLGFSALSDEQLRRKIREKAERSESPFFYVLVYGPPTLSWQGTWSGSLTASVWNPDTFSHYDLYVTTYAGPCSFLGVGEALMVRETRWPVKSAGRFVLGPQRGAQVEIDYSLPSGYPRGLLIGNLVLWEGPQFSQGTLYDRALWTANF